jgi:hypothetical protein
MKRFSILLLLASFLSVFALGESAPKKDPGAEEAKTSIDFDADVVEGMNRQPLDSLTQLSEGEGAGAKKHLYRRAKKFNEENRELAREQEETY